MHRLIHRRAFVAPALLAATLLAGCAGTATPNPTASGDPAASGAASPPGPAPTTDQPTGGPVTDDNKLCDLLGPGDFEIAGIPGAGLPEVSSDGPGSAYCVYAGDSAGTGGLEFDAFIDEDPEAVFETIRTEGGIVLEAIDVAGADGAEGWDGVAGSADQFGRIVVQAGSFVFTIGAPGGEGTLAKLVALSEVVVVRAEALTGR